MVIDGWVSPNIASLAIIRRRQGPAPSRFTSAGTRSLTPDIGAQDYWILKCSDVICPSIIDRICGFAFRLGRMLDPFVLPVQHQQLTNG